MTARKRYWLMKSEPDAFSIDDLQRVGTEPWNGVRNYQARNFMRDGMKVGDGVLFYHSNAKVPGIVGIAITLAVLGHYLLWAFQRSREAERRALELQVLAREAELKSLRAQLDPHFLFNSLNSVAALIGNDTGAAREMCLLMAQFFRKSLSFGRQQAITLADEISLAETFLAIERVRFGERLRTQFDIAEDVRTVSVPPLMLQPLVENAVHHGVAHLLEGGEVRVRARRRDNFIELVVENPCDPDRPPSRSTGVGLVNVRSRIETLCGHRASVDVDAGESHFRVSILLPAAAAAS